MGEASHLPAKHQMDLPYGSTVCALLCYVVKHQEVWPLRFFPLLLSEVHESVIIHCLWDTCNGIDLCFGADGGFTVLSTVKARSVAVTSGSSTTNAIKGAQRGTLIAKIVQV